MAISLIYIITMIIFQGSVVDNRLHQVNKLSTKSLPDHGQTHVVATPDLDYLIHKIEREGNGSLRVRGITASTKR